MLKEFRIRNFRCFQDLSLQGLGHANLIVGRNNTGKSYLLDALGLWCELPNPLAVTRSLWTRDELRRYIAPQPVQRAPGAIGDRESDTWPFQALFYGRPEIRNGLSLSLEANGHADVLELCRVRRNSAGLYSKSGTVEEPVAGTDLGMEATSGSDPHWSASLDVLATGWNNGVSPRMPVSSVATYGAQDLQIATEWEKHVFTSLAEDAVQAIQVLEPSIEGITTVAGAQTGERLIVAKLRNASRPVPLRSLGEGVSRVLGLVLALASAQGGLVLIDEVESGLHRTVQRDSWRTIIRIAKQLRVQVFAVTHSLESVTAFSEATKHDSGTDGVLFRLERTESGIHAVNIAEDELDAMLKLGLEMR